MKKKSLHDILEDLRSSFKGGLAGEISLHELSISVQKEVLLKVLTFLRDHPTYQFKQLVDLCGVDYPSRPCRFDVVYHLLSHTLNKRIRVKVSVDDGDSVPSLSSLFNSANWYEREAWDLFGIPFEGHPDLRRILTDYGFEGHPLRKDFPLTGYVEVRYDDEERRVKYEKIQLPQEYRNFDFVSPWEGMTPQAPVLPGDEKATKEF